MVLEVVGKGDAGGCDLEGSWDGGGKGGAGQGEEDRDAFLTTG